MRIWQKNSIGMAAILGFFYILICPSIAALGTKCPMPSQIQISYTSQNEGMPPCHSKAETPTSESDSNDCCEGNDLQISSDQKSKFNDSLSSKKLELDYFSSYYLNFSNDSRNNFLYSNVNTNPILSYSDLDQSQVLLI